MGDYFRDCLRGIPDPTRAVRASYYLVDARTPRPYLKLLLNNCKAPATAIVTP